MTFRARCRLVAFAMLLAIPARPDTRSPAPAPYPPAEAASHMTLPPGFTATLFAGEPDVVQPIATAMDDRGRVWVAECMSYPHWHADPKDGTDRILIFEDARGDGHFSKRSIFADHLSNISGLEIGFGGVWVCSSPNLIFIPTDATGDKPAGPAKVVLDGWDIKSAQHNVFNRLTWGPDGWLYGCNGILSKSNVGKAGAPDSERTPINCGVWRYHPIRQVFERVAQGTTNPWGLDFDDYGQMFITNCVIEHLFEVIPGAHYKRMFGEDFNPHTYGLMQTCADHIHWAGGPWQSSRSGDAHGDAGGGHAHAGCMVYLGDNFPESYRNSVFMCNIHGNRVNNDYLEQKGSGTVAHHGKDFLFANDTWFRGLNLMYGPDGGVYVNDWTDTGECHNHEVIDQTNGRVYKVVYGKPAAVHVNLAEMSDGQLVDLQLHKNDWYVRHARRLLQERAVAGKLSPGVVPGLRKILNENPDVTRKLRALWALHGIGTTDGSMLANLLDRPEPYVRAWAIRLSVDGGAADAAWGRFDVLAASDPSPVVRLALASACQRIPQHLAAPVMKQLVQHTEDAKDANLPLMDWYGVERIASTNAEFGLQVAATAQLPPIREYTARLMTSTDVNWLPKLVNKVDALEKKAEILRGAQAALQGRRHVDPPADWDNVAPSLVRSALPEVRLRALLLSLTFGQKDAEAGVRALINDTSAPVADRREALSVLVQSKPASLAPFLQQVLDDKDLGDIAIRSLASSGDASTPAVLIAHYASFSMDNKRDAINTLASRKGSALQMLEAVEAGRLPRQDLNALTVRQLSHLGDPTIDAKVKKLWGVIRAASEEKQQQMAQLKAELAPETMKKAKLPNGRLVFSRTCAQCHTLYDAGGNVGPNLTGSQRANLDYLLENILDPSAIVAKEYQMTLVKTTDGQVLTGIIESDGPNGLTLKMPNQSVTVPQNEIKTRKTEAISMMPEGLLQGMSAEDRRDLIGYLQSSAQVALPPGAR